MLRIEHLTKEYGDNQLIDDLSLHIMPGEIYGLIGHNGSGKTTTLKCCCGIKQVRSGEIYVDGISMQKKPPGAGGPIKQYNNVFGKAA